MKIRIFQGSHIHKSIFLPKYFQIYFYNPGHGPLPCFAGAQKCKPPITTYKCVNDGDCSKYNLDCHLSNFAVIQIRTHDHLK